MASTAATDLPGAGSGAPPAGFSAGLTATISRPSERSTSSARAVSSYTRRGWPVAASRAVTGASAPSVTYTVSPSVTRRLPISGGMVNRGTMPLPGVPLKNFESQFGTGHFHRRTPLNASRATTNHLLGTVPSTQASVSSQRANSRPPADTMALTLGVQPWLRAQSGPAVHTRCRGGPTWRSCATALPPGPCR